MKDLPRRHFGTILADPPWPFQTYSEPSGTVPHRTEKSPYDAMTMEDMMALPVADVAAGDAILFMWVIDSHLDAALQLAGAWGFAYKTCAFVWFKSRGPHDPPQPGMGYWTRKQTEQCWLFTRGKPKRRDKGVEQALFCRRGAHSAKPDEQYDRIMRLTYGPYLELFSRLSRPGWTAWGNQVGLRDGLFGFDNTVTTTGENTDDISD